MASDAQVPLARSEIAALRAVGRRPYLSYGQDGCTSTAAVRRLQAMGLVMVNPSAPQPGGWTAALTVNGRQKLAEAGDG